MNLWRSFIHQAQREWLLSIRQPKILVYAVLFFIMIIVFFPLTLTPGSGLLRQIAPGLLWMTQLLVLLLASEALFHQEYEEGIVEQWIVSTAPLPLIAFTKIAVFWLISIVPVILLSPLFALLLGLTYSEIKIFIISLILGTPAIFYLCALASVFAVGHHNKGVFMSLILLPLAIPILIFGSGILQAAMAFAQIKAYLALLAAISLLCVSFLPWAIASIMRLSLGAD